MRSLLLDCTQAIHPSQQPICVGWHLALIGRVEQSAQHVYRGEQHRDDFFGGRDLGVTQEVQKAFKTMRETH
jgi:hypothetical protein